MELRVLPPCLFLSLSFSLYLVSIMKFDITAGFFDTAPNASFHSFCSFFEYEKVDAGRNTRTEE